MGLFGRKKLADEERRQAPTQPEDKDRNGQTFLGIPLHTTSERLENVTGETSRSAADPEIVEYVEERPRARTNPSTYSTIITTESGASRPGLQRNIFLWWLLMQGIPSDRFKEIEKTLVTRLDLVIMPLTMFLYLFTFLDKHT